MGERRRRPKERKFGTGATVANGTYGRGGREKNRLLAKW